MMPGPAHISCCSPHTKLLAGDAKPPKGFSEEPLRMGGALEAACGRRPSGGKAVFFGSLVVRVATFAAARHRLRARAASSLDIWFF